MIEIKDLYVDLKGFSLCNINLLIKKGDFFILLGPTGAGKSVLIEAIAGLIPVKSGGVLIQGVDVTRLPPEKRGISIVYQDYALFPHLSVLENVRYGLSFQRISKAEKERRIEWIIDQLDLRGLLNRYPETLSGGERQRVAIARALVVKPSVLFLDEPLSALDVNLREEVRAELKRLHEITDTTFLMVTHDLRDALYLGNRGAIINHGQIVQQGNIDEIFKNPSNSFVARLIGMKNIFPARFNGDFAYLEDIELELEICPPNSKGYIAISPEDVVIHMDRPKRGIKNVLKGTISGIIDQRYYHELEINVKGVIFTAIITKKGLFEPVFNKERKEIHISINPSKIHTLFS